MEVTAHTGSPLPSCDIVLDPAGIVTPCADAETSPLLEDGEFPNLRLDFIEAPLPVHLFSVRLTNCLHNNGIQTVGHLLAAVFEKREFKNLGAGTRRELNSLLEDAAQRTGTVPFWNLELLDAGNCVPSNDEIRGSDNGVPLLPCALEIVVKALFGNSIRYAILARRAGLDGHRLYTLEELALLYGKSRERIRQIEVDTANRFAIFLTKGSLKKVERTLHPCVHEEIATFLNLLKAKGLLISQQQLQDIINTRYQNSMAESQKNLFLYHLELLGIVPVKFESNTSKTQTAWLTNASQKERVLLVEKYIAQKFKVQVLPIHLDDVVIYVNKNLRPQNIKASTLLIEEMLRLCELAEPCEGNTAYRTAFVRLPSHAHRVHRVLYEKGEPLATHELVKEINHRIVTSGTPALGRQNLVTDVTVVNPLASYEPVVTEGRSRWKLKEWGGETRTILQVMEEFFHLHNRPASPDEVFAYVQAKRHAKRASIVLYLSMDKRFRRVGADEYALASWRHAEYAQQHFRRRVSQANFDKAIQAVFTSSQAPVLSLSVLTAALCQTLQCSDMSARGHIKASLLVRLARHENGVHYLVHLRDSEHPASSQDIAQANKTKTQITLVQEKIVELLATAPESGLLSAVLVRKLRQATMFPRATIYVALGKMKGSVERVVEPSGIKYKMKQKN